MSNHQRSSEEIPEALREVTPPPKTKLSRGWLLLVGGVGLSLLAVISGMTRANRNSQPEVISSPAPQLETPRVETPEEETATEKVSNDLLGHLPYEEASQDELTSVTADGRIKLRTPAAKKFIEMQAAARREGVFLVPLSGFRSIEQQEFLFFEIKAQRGQVATERAEVSAPPGYSEHHTGYAIDIGDGKAPATHVEETFAKTAAFAWLEENAARYSFELSFPENNPQGISFEPWHWRYVGNRESLEIFYQQQS